MVLYCVQIFNNMYKSYTTEYTNIQTISYLSVDQ
jgi:hypothetical protein